MPLSVWFWLIAFAWVVCSGWASWGVPAPGRYPLLGASFFLLLLVLLLGWKVFGAAIR